MSANKKNTDPSSMPDDDIPDMTTPYWEEKISAARRGRPRLEQPKVSTTIRLDKDVLEHFRNKGKGWQTRMNEALRKAARL